MHLTVLMSIWARCFEGKRVKLKNGIIPMNLSFNYFLESQSSMKSTALVKRSSSQVTDQAVEIIHERIQNGIYPVGSALPSQRELSSELGISRASLREALTRLAALGLLNIMAGKGAYVTALESQPVEQWNIQFKNFT